MSIIHDLGYLESGLTYSFVPLVLCAEIVSWIKAFARDFEVNEETLALDVIAQLGPDGDFLNTDYPLNHFRERWYPTHFERANDDSWLEKGGKNFTQRAAEAIDRILAGHKPDLLPAQTKAKLHEIVP
jgi:trimethylamine--corrinoid protein Co-methyltransferase